ncbi:MAG: hypothetical protein ABR507_11905 [Actinomycetota bacterium]|nr:hypothetical protein [Actinomycetota bacterium]
MPQGRTLVAGIGVATASGVAAASGSIRGNWLMLFGPLVVCTFIHLYLSGRRDKDIWWFLALLAALGWACVSGMLATGLDLGHTLARDAILGPRLLSATTAYSCTLALLGGTTTASLWLRMLSERDLFQSNDPRSSAVIGWFEIVLVGSVVARAGSGIGLGAFILGPLDRRTAVWFGLSTFVTAVVIAVLWSTRRAAVSRFIDRYRTVLAVTAATMCLASVFVAALGH